MIKRTYREIEYKLEPSKHGLAKFTMSIWYSLTKEYIFECSCSSDEDARRVIDSLLSHGFIIK